jgi:hypothetical protein
MIAGFFLTLVGLFCCDSRSLLTLVGLFYCDSMALFDVGRPLLLR